MIGSPSDIVIADLVHGAIAVTRPGHPGRFGDRKVFISAIWDALHASGDDRWIPWLSRGPGRSSIADFKRWLVSAMRLTDASGRPLVVLVRSDMADATAHHIVVASETISKHTEKSVIGNISNESTFMNTYHLVVDRMAGAEFYAPSRKPVVVIGLPRGRNGRNGDR